MMAVPKMPIDLSEFAVRLLRLRTDNLARAVQECLTIEAVASNGEPGDDPRFALIGREPNLRWFEMVEGRSLLMCADSLELPPVQSEHVLLHRVDRYWCSGPVQSPEDAMRFLSNETSWVNPLAFFADVADLGGTFEVAVRGLLIRAYDDDGYIACLLATPVPAECQPET